MKTIAVDIDDVLAAHTEAFLRFSNNRWGTRLTPEDYDEHWAKMWDIDHKETEARANEFHRSGVFADFAHHQAAGPVLRELAKTHRLVIVTSRRKMIMQETLDWIEQKFGDIFAEVYFAGIWDTVTADSATLTKADICLKVGVDYLIDDQLKHCLAVAEVGLEAVLYGDYPWNRTGKLPRRVTRCHDWLAVKEYFDARK